VQVSAVLTSQFTLPYILTYADSGYFLRTLRGSPQRGARLVRHCATDRGRL